VEKLLMLLKEKNFYLEKFFEESEKERKSFKARKFENLQALYKTRESILLNIADIDEKITSVNLRKMELDEKTKGELSGILENKKQIISKILDQDLQIISCVEKEKSSIINKISSLREGKMLINKYRQKSI
jgi:hypothetical protein